MSHATVSVFPNKPIIIIIIVERLPFPFFLLYVLEDDKTFSIIQAVDALVCKLTVEFYIATLSL